MSKERLDSMETTLFPFSTADTGNIALIIQKAKSVFSFFSLFSDFSFSGTNPVPSPDRRYWHIQDISSPNGSAISDSPSAYHRKYRILDLKIQNPIFFVCVSTQHSPFPDEFEAGFFTFKSSKLTETLATGKMTFTRSCCKSA